jgi:hypothetical protein
MFSNVFYNVFHPGQISYLESLVIHDICSASHPTGHDIRVDAAGVPRCEVPLPHRFSDHKMMKARISNIRKNLIEVCMDRQLRLHQPITLTLWHGHLTFACYGHEYTSISDADVISTPSKPRGLTDAKHTQQLWIGHRTTSVTMYFVIESGV